MARIDRDDPFDFLAEAEDRRALAEPLAGPGRPPRRRAGRLMWATLHSALLVVGLNLAGLIRIPHLERATSDPRAGDAAAARATASTPAPHGRPAVAPARPPAPRRIAPASATPVVAPRVAPPTLAEPPFGPDEARTILAEKRFDRQPAGFTLRAEATVDAKLVALRSTARESRDARLRAAELDAIRERVTLLNQEEEATGLQVAQLGLQMEQFPGRWHQGRLWHGNTVQEDAMHQGLAAQHKELRAYRLTQLIPLRNELRNQLAGGAAERAVEASGRLAQDQRECLDELREAVRAARDEFVRLAADPQATRALRALGQATLRPSPTFLAAVEELGGFERAAGREPSFPRSAWPEAWSKTN